MANETVTLLRYAKVPELGWRRGKAIIGKTGKVTPDYMLLGKRNNKRKVHAPEGHFELCHFEGRLPRYKKLGNDPSEALDELQRAKSELKFKQQGIQLLLAGLKPNCLLSACHILAPLL